MGRRHRGPTTSNLPGTCHGARGVSPTGCEFMFNAPARPQSARNLCKARDVVGVPAIRMMASSPMHRRESEARWTLAASRAPSPGRSPVNGADLRSASWPVAGPTDDLPGPGASRARTACVRRVMARRALAQGAYTTSWRRTLPGRVRVVPARPAFRGDPARVWRPRAPANSHSPKRRRFSGFSLIPDARSPALIGWGESVLALDPDRSRGC